jgi:hypothetical protein
MFSVGKITKYWLILFKIEVKKIILFVPMTGNAIVILFVNVMVEKLLQSKYPYL